MKTPFAFILNELRYGRKPLASLGLILISSVALAEPAAVKPAVTAPIHFSEPKPNDFNDHEGYISLFDGVSLKGWDGNKKFWRVEDGAIIGESTPENPSGNSYLVYRDLKAKDFTLKFEMKVLGKGGSGFQYRSQTGMPWLAAVQPEVIANSGPVNLNWMMTGPQADFWPSEEYTGQFYTENDPMRIVAWRGQVVESYGAKGKQLMGIIGDRKALGNLVKPDEWNEYTVIARGGTFIHIVNGQLMSVAVDDDPVSINNQPGLFGIEIEAVTKVFVRNIWVKEQLHRNPAKADELPVDHVRVDGGMPAPAPRAVHIKIDASQPTGPLKPIWRFFGADEPNYAYMKHGGELLGELGALKKNQVFFRAHSLLTTGKGEHSLKWGSTNAYTEDPAGNPVYDWTIVDRIFDAYRSNGVRPYVQFGFMPKALSVKPEPYRHNFPNSTFEKLFVGWAYPPKDYSKWEELIYQLAKHCVEKYGEQEVLNWYWQTWNEANTVYWKGTREEFYKLHDHAIRAVRRAIPKAKVGGPDIANGKGGDYLEGFIDHCLKGKNLASGESGTPLDFISFHAKGSPAQVDGHIRMGISAQLNDIDGAFGVVAKYPELKSTPIVIGESDPEGCAACQGGNYAYRNGTMYSSYTAASFPRKLDLAEKHGINLEGALTWAFEFEDQPYFAGFRTLASNGIAKPVLNVFRMFSRMDGQRLQVVSDAAVPLDELLKTGVRGKPDVSALAARAGKRITVFAWHYHDDDVHGADAAITLELRGTPAGSPKITRTLVDETHSNSFTAWLAMGSPQSPTADQIRELEDASQLGAVPDQTKVKATEGQAEITFNLARQGVTLLELEWP